MSQDFYRAFEDRHRGSRDLIRDRQRVYLSFLRPLAQLGMPPQAVDLGCGRGEWLELLRGEGWRASGVDLDEGMLAACHELGLDVRSGDVLQHLQSLATASLSVVSALHVAEHMPFRDLQLLVSEALRVLRPGGLLILETPNPENLVVGSSGFYMDPTHARPLPPPLLAFLAEFSGFGRVATLRLHEALAPPGRPVELIHVLAGVSPDYAIVAQKGELNGNADDQARAALDAAFAQACGSSLIEAAARYDQQWSARLREMHVIGEMARESSILLTRGQQALKERLDAIERANAIGAGLERGAVNHVFALNDQISALNRQVEAMRRSTSWRLTAPLRWAGALPRALRQRGVKGTARGALRHVAMASARTAARILRDRPKARAAIMRAAKRLGLERYLQRMRSTPPAPVIIQESNRMTASAHRVHQNLRFSLTRRLEKKEELVADRH
ncbi:hypothetical protein GCM10027034_20940 [Ramlibacter solisilvae]|uniref:class I SAM-dependent methyltransferase n=1 Tax=Ramlibacter tataouinensis TaxID=94132 RepID=UPI0009ED1829|nr:class I SAM-dependent methyltransferase [Ramlibacter tataouinensis]